MKRTRESAKESDNAKRQTTLSSFIVKPRFPTRFHLHYNEKDNTFRASFLDSERCPDEHENFHTKIYWSGNELPTTLSTNMRNGSFEDQDEWHDKCHSMCSAAKIDIKNQHFEDFEWQFYESLNAQDIHGVKANAAAMACFERDWSGSPVNGLRRFLQILSSIKPDERDGINYAELVWLQCAETKGFMINSTCLDFLITYVGKACSRTGHKANKCVEELESKTMTRVKPTLSRILLLKDRSTEIRDVLLAIYLRSEYLSSRQEDRDAMWAMLSRWYNSLASSEVTKDWLRPNNGLKLIK
ncbi:hypothetical protein INT43_003138 [Umbelopsis isabellina]|uniref:Uncharacterized protein n=1 Tax=Mortierella isabellina TaxID=91625 RepID=A0A8H7UA17_MORIS|nr:hypothetical protein INT43_003138 [Umbelopsis isabellina]